MARKNGTKTDKSETFLFDTRTRAVMSQATAQDNKVRTMVQSVREVVPGKSNNDIHLVLQYYDYDVEKTIHAFLEDGAKVALDDWHMPSKQQVIKKKKKSKPKKPDQSLASQSNQAEETTTTTTTTSSQPITSSAAVADAPQINGHEPMQEGAGTPKTPNTPAAPPSSVQAPQPVKPLPQRATQKPAPRTRKTSTGKTESQPTSAAVSRSSETKIKVKGRTPSPSRKAAGNRHEKSSSPVLKDTTKSAQESGSAATAVVPPSVPTANRQDAVRPKSLHERSLELKLDVSRERTISETSTSSTGAKRNKPHGGLEKSLKDLQRQTTSLQRLKILLDDEMAKSFKRIKQVFEDCHRQLTEREIEQVQKMNVVKKEANLLLMRQNQAAELRTKAIKAPNMSDHEIAILRAEIKHYVSERKVDEDVSRTTRFIYDSDHMSEEIRSFTEVVPVKATYSQRRPSDVSLSSYDDPLSPHTPMTTLTPLTPLTLTPTLANHNSKLTVIPTAAPVREEETEVELTADELADLQMRLQNTLRRQGLPSAVRQAKLQSQSGKSQTGSNPSDQDRNQANNELPDGAKKMRNARRRQRARERQREKRVANQNGDEEEQENGGRSEEEWSEMPYKPVKEKRSGGSGDAPQGHGRDDRPKGGQRSNTSPRRGVGRNQPQDNNQRGGRGNRGGRNSASPNKGPRKEMQRSPKNLPQKETGKNAENSIPKESTKEVVKETQKEAEVTKEVVKTPVVKETAKEVTKEVVKTPVVKETAKEVVKESFVKAAVVKETAKVTTNGQADEVGKGSVANKDKTAVVSVENALPKDPLPQRKQRENRAEKRGRENGDVVMVNGAVNGELNGISE